VLASGAKGILFNSILTRGTNLVLYNDALTPTDSLAVRDPNQALPRNQDSRFRAARTPPIPKSARDLVADKVSYSNKTRGGMCFPLFVNPLF
jgi:hypothetical protein